MPKFDIEQASASQYTSLDKYSIDTKQTDGVSEQDETTWQNPKWTQYWAYFNSITELKSAILMKAIWNVGKGYEAEPEIQVILEHMTGWGKDTFDDILFNMEVIRRVNGDSFAEIIRDEDTGEIINLKTLDPASIIIVVDRKGIIKRYEQVSKVKSPNKKIMPNDMFHLSHNRLSDQIHGISDIAALEKVILAEAESFDDMQKIMHFQAKPFIIFKMKTDDTTKITNFKTKIKDAIKDGEDMFIPDDENLLTWEIVQVNVSQIVLEWRNDLKNKFYRALNIPLVAFGQAGSTESGSKMEVFAHENVFEHDQRYLEKQIEAQLNKFS